MEFDSNEALLRFLEDEGLSPFTLLKITPKPSATGKKLPASVAMEWGLTDLEYDGEKERFLAWQVSAEELVTYRAEGELDRFDECHTELGDARGIDVRLVAGGTLFLRCARLVVSDEPVERLRKGRPRPSHGEFHVTTGEAAATWGEVRRWFGTPAELTWLVPRTTNVVADDARVSELKHVRVEDDAGHAVLWLSAQGGRFTVSRGKWAADALWNGVWSRATTVPGTTAIASRTLVCPPGTWPNSPPPKPAPQVWPDVYGVTCAFDAMTLGELREVLALPSTSAFVFDRPDALEPRDALTLVEAGRHAGRMATGEFRDAGGKTLVHVNVDVVEIKLAFRRGPACDDATWIAIWRASEKLPGVRERNSRTTCSPPDPWPQEPPAR